MYRYLYIIYAINVLMRKEKMIIIINEFIIPIQCSSVIVYNIIIM